MGPADSVKVSRDSTYSGYFRRPSDFAYGTFALYGAAVPNGFRYRSIFLLRMKVLQPRSENPSGLGYSAFARRYLRNRFSFFSCRYLDVSVPCVSPPMRYLFSHGYLNLTSDGFPHSDIAGSLRAYRSPTRFAVRCVLLRLLVPRHSPYALLHLT